MMSILDALRERGILVSDGGWGSFLMAKGLQPGECPELWNVDRPEDVRAVAQMYVDAGAGFIMTNSFGANRFKLAHYGLESRVAELNRAAAAISRQAAGDRAYVLASMGPTGKILMMGDVTEEEMYEAFREQALALEEGGADACAVETMAAIDEACLGVRAAKENTNLAVVCSFTYDTPTPQGYRTMMGVPPATMAAAALEAGADILGVNCSLGSAEMVEVVRDLREAAPGTPILVHPNAGKPEVLPDGALRYPETPEIMAACVPDFIAAGASIIGGCCGTGPDHIRAIKAAVEQYNAAK